MTPRLLATGLRGVGAVSEVGRFLPGGALHDDPAWAAYCQPGAVFDPQRVLVASSSNFGAPRARPQVREGAILSLDVAGPALVVPPDFARADGQASTAGGRVQLFAAQSPAFQGPVNTPATSEQTSVSFPTSISLNNGSGRPWFANGTAELGREGSVTVTNPNGRPTAVFAGSVTNRDPTVHQGLGAPALGTTLITKSPEETNRPVFAAVLSDGSLVQVHVTKGVDPLSPAATVSPVGVPSIASAESTSAREIARLGIMMNWAPTMNVIVPDARANRIVVLDIGDDGALFTVTGKHVLAHPALDLPIDLAPAVREVAHPNFASNSMLGGGSDFYVLNRGDNSIVRMTIEGRMVAKTTLASVAPGMRVSGIAVSANSQTLYVTANTRDGGILLSTPAFAAHAATASLLRDARKAGASSMHELGSFLFSKQLDVTHGLGPLFNERACIDCHLSPTPGGMGIEANTFVTLFGRRGPRGGFDPLAMHGGPVERTHSVAELGERCRLRPGLPARANVFSPRSSMSLRGSGLIDAIREYDILVNRDAQPAAVRGRAAYLPDGRLGKFGWKAHMATLVDFMGEAYRNELGITNPIFREDLVSGCGANGADTEIDALPLTALVSFLNTLDPPAPSEACLASPGATRFAALGCADCHTPSLPGRNSRVPLYSDLLLHSMGPGLRDGVEQGGAAGDEWRTPPLWELSTRAHFLHDGRVATVHEAIAEHGGQAAAARDAYLGLDVAAQRALQAFLGCL
ncbi:MAG: di-heme oxidoredictase family protein [Polyangiales bacterium]